MALNFEHEPEPHGPHDADPSEHRFRELANSLPQTVFEMDLAGNLTFVNRSGYDMWQATDEDVRRGINVFDWILPEDHASVRANMKRVLGGEFVGSEYRARRKDGSVFPIVVHARPIVREGAPVGLRGMLIDLSAQKRTEQALRESEERFRQMADALPETIIEMDPEGRLTFINGSAFERWGYTRDDFERGLFGLEMLVPEDRTDARDVFARAQAGERAVTEYTALRKDGTRFPVLVRTGPIARVDRVVGARAVLVDLTELKRIEDARANTERRFRSLVQNAAFGVYRTTLDGRFVEVNPALVSMLGYSSERELLAVPVLALYADARDRRILVERFMKAEHVNGVEVLWKRKDGTPLVVRLNGRWVGDDGLPEGFEMIVEDVSAQRALEDQLHQSQKMDAIGRLAGGVAHDFNNVLTVILGYTGLLLEQLGEDDPRRSEASEIHKAADRASSLTRQLLAFSRKQVLQPRPIDLNAVAANLEPMLRRLIGEDVQLTIDAARPLWRVKADPGQIEQVIMNLAVNARDAMPGGGKLTIRTANVDLDAASARKQGTSPGRHVVLAISDTGCGMTAQVRAHLFEPFFTTKEYGKGTGLGLATVYGIVRQSGGQIAVHSEIKRGTTFTTYFPAVQAETQDVRVAQPARAEAAKGSGTVLLVEDEEAVGRLASELLARQGYGVLYARSGEQALQMAAEHGGRIDLLLTDVVMPGISGRELVKQLKQARPDTKVLYMSGYTEHAVITGGELGQGVAFLQKPFTRDSLIQAVRTAVAP